MAQEQKLQQPQQHEHSSHPGILLHTAISRNNFQTCQTILSTHGSIAGTYKNARGSTPLMLAAEGKPSKRTSLQLIELLLQDGMGGMESAAERSRKGRTAADILSARAGSEGGGQPRLVELAARLRSYECGAAECENFDRCPIPHCRAKLPARGRTKLHFVADEVRKGSECNPLLVDMCIMCTSTRGTASPAVVQRLGGALYHRVNSCVAFRKECTESMALIRELRCLRANARGGSIASAGIASCTGDLAGTPGSETTTSRDLLQSKEDDEDDWSSWHVIDLCAGSCLTGCLALALLPGIRITAVDLRGAGNHHHDAENSAETEAYASEGGDGSEVGSGNDGAAYDVEAHLRAAGVLIPDQFRYVSGDLHDPHLVEVLAAHLSPNQSPSEQGKHRSNNADHVVVLGMHCCGMLSVQAVEIADQLEADALLLMPCCLPAKNTVHENDIDDNGKLPPMADLYSSPDQDEQYRWWASYLAALARSKDIGMAGLGSVRVREVKDVISARNILVTVESGTAGGSHS
eukprot:CAMPEP_0172316682 /NCGR_PEP_ID=MMETSP1058-20130122/29078_1 /TAXON_ID=83371 /ORGANISM="Detonula confervacea, Strain CCMP 353" /LENGTH=520 /DNA_ID=CAMNT_0013031047 /DNA_START=52 /DNA_END=1614 /DNA_ORIENTATION=+